MPGNYYYIGEVMNAMSDRFGWDSVIPICREDKK